ncbi:uncharacterized protein LOC101236102 isoform X1 [Hydra vulgaris]|uniref:uncharacterized protein LOC101236102 isoform X1 n=1 Tax=Hydra vulgaris TaxID=6087 RepID=UPI001F5FA66E|nr:uncharacterized protein LOC101236102 [Hydra vulgaris]
MSVIIKICCVYLLSLFVYNVCKAEESDIFSKKYNMKFEEIFGKDYKENIFSKPKSVSEELDCEIRKLAYQFAMKLNPGQGSLTELRAVHEALQLEACGSKFVYKNEYKPSELDLKDALNIFVDNINGDFIRTGKINAPFQDIQSGIDECQKQLKLGFPNKCVVNIRGGMYNISSPLFVTSSNLVLTNYRDEEVIVTSDLNIDVTWKSFKSSLDIYMNVSPIFENLVPKQSTKSVIYLGSVTVSQCRELCEEKPICSSFIFFDNSTKDFANQCYIRTDGMWNTKKFNGVISGKKVNIFSADLSGFNLPVFDQMFFADQRLVKARFPNANPEIQGLHTFPTGYIDQAASWLPPKVASPPIDIKLQSPNRPNSYFSSFFVGIGGTVSQFEPPSSYWGSSSPVAGSIYNVPSGLRYYNDSEFNSRSWKNPSTGVVHAFHGDHWGNWMFKLDSRDQGSQTLKWSWGGFQEARGDSNGREWYIENIFEELDVANEWFYDKEEKILYYFPNVTANGEFILPSKFQVPQLPSLIRMIGSKDNPIINTAVSGLTLLHSTQTFMEPYQVPSGGDWSVHPNGMLFLEGTVNVTISNCIFNSPGGNGIFVKGFHRNLQISQNTMFNLGDNGIVLVGQSKLIDGSEGYHPDGTRIYKNIIYEIGIWGKQSYSFVQSVSRGTIIDSNVFFNGPRAGININDGFGGGNMIQNNLLFNFVRETDDHGPINTWDRVPYLTRNDGRLSMGVKLNHIYKNFLVNNYRSVWPIDHDDGSSYWFDSFNFLVYGGFKDYLGHDLHSQNNIYVYPKDGNCVLTIGQIKYVTGYNDTFSSNICVTQNTQISNLGSCNQKDIFALIPLFAENIYYTPSGAIQVNCGGSIWNLTTLQQQGMEKGSISQILPSDFEIVNWGKELFSL